MKLSHLAIGIASIGLVVPTLLGVLETPSKCWTRTPIDGCMVMKEINHNGDHFFGKDVKVTLYPDHTARVESPLVKSEDEWYQWVHTGGQYHMYSDMTRIPFNFQG